MVALIHATPPRDPAPSDKEKWERTLRLERMVIGGYPTELGCSSSADDKSKDGNNDYGDAEGREAVDTVVKAPFDRYVTPPQPIFWGV